MPSLLCLRLRARSLFLRTSGCVLVSSTQFSIGLIYSEMKEFKASSTESYGKYTFLLHLFFYFITLIKVFVKSPSILNEQENLHSVLASIGDSLVHLRRWTKITIHFELVFLFASFTSLLGNSTVNCSEKPVN